MSMGILATFMKTLYDVINVYFKCYEFIQITMNLDVQIFHATIIIKVYEANSISYISNEIIELKQFKNWRVARMFRIQWLCSEVLFRAHVIHIENWQWKIQSYDSSSNNSNIQNDRFQRQSHL